MFACGDGFVRVSVSEHGGKWKEAGALGHARRTARCGGGFMFRSAGDALHWRASFSVPSKEDEGYEKKSC